MKLNPLDKSGFTFAVSTLWGKFMDKFSSLAKVATSGKYIDLTGRPTKLSEFENDAGFKTTDTTYGVVSKTANGLAPKLPNETTTTKYLRQDGAWAVPPNTTYGNMSGASASAVGKAGLVPAPAAGMQDAVLMGKGAWGKLGAAASYNVSNNDTTTEEGFLADARRIKALRDDIDKLNSALDGIGYTYKAVSGKTYVAAYDSIQNVGNRSMATSLDTMHASISNYVNGMYTIAGANQFFCVFLCKNNNASYCGLIMSYYMYPPMFFSVNGETHRLAVAVTI